MAEGLGKPLPHLAEDAFTRIGAEEVPAGGQGGSAGGAEAVEHVFEDPEVCRAEVPWAGVQCTAAL